MSSASGTPRCLNCSAEMLGHYCSQCGQADNDLRISLRRLVRDFLADHLGLESKVPVTLWALVRRPGELTKEYLAGRRVRWVLPLKLYLSASLVFFLLLQVPWVRSPLEGNFRITGADRAALDSARQTSGDSVNTVVTADSGVQRLVRKRAPSFGEMTEEEIRSHVVGSLARYLPNVLFAMVPVFAFLLWVLHRKSGRFYAEHLIFALHFHSFVFVAATLMTLSPDIIDPVFTIWIFAYLFVAMRRVYAEPRGRTAAKYLAIVPVYMVFLLVATMGILLVIFTQSA